MATTSANLTYTFAQKLDLTSNKASFLHADKANNTQFSRHI